MATALRDTEVRRQRLYRPVPASAVKHMEDMVVATLQRTSEVHKHHHLLKLRWDTATVQAMTGTNRTALNREVQGRLLCKVMDSLALRHSMVR